MVGYFYSGPDPMRVIHSYDYCFTAVLKLGIFLFILHSAAVQMSAPFLFEYSLCAISLPSILIANCW